MSAPRFDPTDLGGDLGPDVPDLGPFSLLFDYTLDFGREQTIVISRVQAPSEIPRPADYVERLPAAYYLSVDPRFRIVLMTPAYDTVAAISFATFGKPIVELIELPEVPGTGMTNPGKRKKLSGKSSGAKMRFGGDLANSMTWQLVPKVDPQGGWERQPDDDIYDLWVTETIPGHLHQGKKVQKRKVGTMTKAIIAETGTRRVTIEANTKFVGEVAVLASAVTVLKKEALQERQNKLPSLNPMHQSSRGFHGEAFYTGLRT